MAGPSPSPSLSSLAAEIFGLVLGLGLASPLPGLDFLGRFSPSLPLPLDFLGAGDSDDRFAFFVGFFLTGESLAFDPASESSSEEDEVGDPSSVDEAWKSSSTVAQSH